MKKIKILQKTDNPSINLALDTIQKQKQAIIFVNTKRGAEKLAEDLAREIKNVSLIELSEQALSALSKPTKQCERLAKCVKKGIAFHHAGLVAKQRELIENNFRNSQIKIICATPTLAFGLDLPAFRSIIRDLKRYTQRGLSFIPTLEYLQMAGRAGRPRFDKTGEAIAIAATEQQKDEIFERYIKGEPEEIYSKLAVEPVLRTYLLSLISVGFVETKEQILGFFEKTFWAHQFKDMEKLEKIITRMLGLLQDFGFITQEDFVSAGEMQKIKPTIIGKRVAELYIDPLTAHKLITALRRATKTTNEFSFLHLVSSTLEIRPLLRTKAKEFDEIQNELVKYGDGLLILEPSLYDLEYSEFIDAIKTALFFNDWINEKDEEYLLEKYNIRPGELRVKLKLANWLLYASGELLRLAKLQPVASKLIKLRIRLNYGAKEELLPLLKIKGIGRVRARKLFSNNLRDLGDVTRADITNLSQLLGRNIALNIKKQLGQETDIKDLPKVKRIKLGQSSLLDY